MEELPSETLIRLIENHKDDDELVYELRLMLVELTELEGEYKEMRDTLANPNPRTPPRGVSN
jgi:hypothetical protein